MQLLKYAGENGVAAYGILMYAGFVVNSVFMGFTTGISPVISYHYGAGNKKEVQNLLKLNLIILTVTSIFALGMAKGLSRPISMLFVSYDQELYNLTIHAMHIYAFSFLFSGFSIFGSGFFTALNNGIVSAVISFLRTFVFESTAIMLFPLIWGVDGIWFSVMGAEIAAVCVTTLFLVLNRRKYGYWTAAPDSTGRDDDFDDFDDDFNKELEITASWFFSKLIIIKNW